MSYNSLVKFLSWLWKFFALYIGINFIVLFLFKRVWIDSTVSPVTFVAHTIMLQLFSLKNFKLLSTIVFLSPPVAIPMFIGFFVLFDSKIKEISPVFGIVILVLGSQSDSLLYIIVRHFVIDFSSKNFLHNSFNTVVLPLLLLPCKAIIVGVYLGHLDCN